MLRSIGKQSASVASWTPAWIRGGRFAVEKASWKGEWKEESGGIGR